MTRTRYTMPARSQGKLYAQRIMARLDEKDVHRWVFVDGMNPDVQAAYMPRCSLATNAMVHIVLQYPPAPTARAAVKEIIKAAGSNPHLSVCGWPFCLDELDDVTAEGGAA